MIDQIKIFYGSFHLLKTYALSQF